MLATIAFALISGLICWLVIRNGGGVVRTTIAYFVGFVSGLVLAVVAVFVIEASTHFATTTLLGQELTGAMIGPAVLILSVRLRRRNRQASQSK